MGPDKQSGAVAQSPIVPANLWSVPHKLHVRRSTDPAPNRALAAVPRALNLSASGLLLGFLSAAGSMALFVWAFVRLWLFSP